ncbi:MAG: hypothetical protein IJP41_04060 [Synergistaceae bacterium]|nr:hypothetical protein [Synergistaceae bacterium]
MGLLVLASLFIIMFAIATALYFFVYKRIYFNDEDSRGGGGELSYKKFFVNELENLSIDDRKKFHNRRMQLRGRITHIAEFKNEYFLVTLGENTQCFFSYSHHKDTIKILKPGQIIVVKGVYVDYGELEHGLTQCYLLEILSVR